MAHTKAGGSTKLGRESASKRLGLKKNHGEPVRIGEIIIRQRGTKYVNGDNVKRTADDTLIALKSGVVKYYEKTKVRFDGKRVKRTHVRVEAK